MMALRRSGHAWRLADLLAGYATVGAGADIAVGDLALDSRQVVPGTLFLACQGGASHGMADAEQARARGAVAIAAEPSAGWDAGALAKAAVRLGLPVVAVPGLAVHASALADRFFGEPSRQMGVIGVVGASGKSSVAHLLAQSLAAETRCALLAGIGVGFPGDLAQGPPLGRDPVAVQATLSGLRARGAQTVAIALPGEALAAGRTAAVRCTQAVFTPAAADGVTMPQGLLATLPGLRSVVLNADDPASASLLAGLAPGIAVALYGSTPAPPPGLRHDLWVGLRDLCHLPRGVRLSLIAHGVADGGAASVCGGAGGYQEADLERPLLGTLNAGNLLAALATLLARGLTLPAALHALGKARAVPGRLEPFGGGGAPLVAVDCARTPEALGRAIAELRRHGSGRLLTVFGCKGGQGPEQRAAMGAVAEAGSDLVIVTDDDPRGEDGDRIVAQILGGMRDPGAARVARQRGLAIRIALTLAGSADRVLVAGKGQDTVQDMGELKVRFSDRAQVAQALCEWTEGRR